MAKKIITSNETYPELKVQERTVKIITTNKIQPAPTHKLFDDQGKVKVEKAPPIVITMGDVEIIMRKKELEEAKKRADELRAKASKGIVGKITGTSRGRQPEAKPKERSEAKAVVEKKETEAKPVKREKRKPTKEKNG